MRILVGLLVVLAACQQGKSKLDTVGSGSPSAAGSGSAKSPGAGSAAKPGADAIDIDSKDILGRKDTFPEVIVKHVLVGWKDLPNARDPRAQQRTNADAAKLAKDVLAQLQATPAKIDDLIKEYGEDPGMKRGEPYTVKSDTAFVPEFKTLALRLKVNEAGIVKTDFGYHVIERVPPPPPDPLESAAILARQPTKDHVFVHHILIGWKDSPQQLGGPKAPTREKAEADKVLKEVLDKLNAKADVQKAIKDYSDEPGDKEQVQQPLELGDDTPILDQFKNLGLRLNEGEAGAIKTPFGWLVMQRVAAPPPDPLESADILKRPPEGDKVKVKHVLLGWTDVHAPTDQVGKKRSRADLEKLVKDIVGKLKGGAKIEPLMAQYSADEGSAKNRDGKPCTGDDCRGYDVTPTASLVPPFKNLALRLKLKEVGVVKTEFGIHIIQRVE